MAEIESVEAFKDDGEILAWVADLSPQGFVLISGYRILRPVLAYSFESNWHCGGQEQRIFLDILRADLTLRLRHAKSRNVVSEEIVREWHQLILGNCSNAGFEQWPPEGTTPTGGWLFTNWTQSHPYNSMCPVDPNTHQRSYAGCPATAMSQILHCLMEINATTLGDQDDYYHNFGPGNQYWIDDDWQDFGFPDFDSLNIYLDSIQQNYVAQKPLSVQQIAALNFASGAMLKQVYSSSVSGTWGIEQAADAFQRAGFEESRLVYDSDTLLCIDLAENIKNGWPAQLGLLDPQGTVGHNVVVDGYNTNEFYHLNFGWGGSSNGWYTMPPTSAPYNLTVIEGVVMDIIGDNPHVGLPVNHSRPDVDIRFIPGENCLEVSLSDQIHEPVWVLISNISGQPVFKSQPLSATSGRKLKFSIPSLKRGFYLVSVLANGRQISGRSMIF